MIAAKMIKMMNRKIPILVRGSPTMVRYPAIQDAIKKTSPV
jgi:hypothetical protein